MPVASRCSTLALRRPRESWSSGCQIDPSGRRSHSEIASRNGTPHRAVRVPTRLFADIVAEHGAPYYCKIDIEGNDSLCLRGLTPETAPTYISIEMSHPRRGRSGAAARPGYESFKIISQRTRRSRHAYEAWLGYALPPTWSRRLRLRIRNQLGVHSVGGWTFAANSSGPFAEQTPGRWRSYEATERMWRFLRNVDSGTRRRE